MICGVSHIGVAVKNIEETLEALVDILGVPKPEIKNAPERKVRFAVLKIGDIGLELLEDSSEQGRVANFVRERGNGLEHICFLSDAVEKDMDLLRDKGAEFLLDKPNIGLRGKKVAFSIRNKLNGIPFEISEP